MPDLSILLDQLPRGHGPLGLLSSDEFTPPARAFDEALLRGLENPTIGVILCADHRAAPQSLQFARAHFADARVEELDMHARELPHFDVVYVAGGSPNELLAHLQGSEAWKHVERSWREGKVLAGASAGAMVMCARTLVPHEGARVPTDWTDGLGIVRTAGLAVHASTRPREWLHEVSGNAPLPVLALDDSTGVVLREGEEPEIAGPGSVYFI